MTGTVTQKSTMTTEAVFSKDGKHRYLIRKVWNKDLPKAAIIFTSIRENGCFFYVRKR